MKKRTYYDHEPAFRKIREQGGKSWDDLFDKKTSKDPNYPYHEFLEFLRSDYCPKGGMALDIGCGGRQVTFILCDNGFEAFGIDYSETAIEIARENAKKLDKKVTFERGDILNLEDTASELFDLVVDNHVSHCILPQDRPKLFSEIFRVLRPEGVYFATVMAVKEPFRLEDFKVMNVDPETRIQNGNRYYVTEEEFLRELALHKLFPLSIKKDNFDNPSYMDLTVYARKK